MDDGICLPNFPDGASREGMEAAATQVRAFEALGVAHVALNFNATDRAAMSALAERFAQEVAPLV